MYTLPTFSNQNKRVWEIFLEAIATAYTSGPKLAVQLMHEMEDRDDAKYGMVTMCIGGGQGATGIFEKI